MKRMIHGILIAAMGMALLACSSPSSDTPDAPKVINLLAIPGVTAPVLGEAPVTTPINTDQYTGTISWTPADSPFVAETPYTSNIELTAKAGWTLTGVAANSLTVAGATTTNAKNSGAVAAVFPATGVTPVAAITLLAIPGVTAPITGATPVTTITETAQYTGTVSWRPLVSDLFISNTEYTATITLTPKAGYTLSGVAANSFTVTNTNTTNPSDSGIVRAKFAITTANLVAVSNVTSTSQTGITLIAVQGGTFNNGTANMTVSSFRMSQHEITGEQYAAVMEVADPSYFASVTNNPVEMVTWYDAVEFCNKLSGKDSLTPVYTITGRTPATGYPITAATVTADWSANGYRLPTAAEWQFAARGGNSTHNYTYAGSNTIDGVAWYTSNSTSTTHPVGSKTTGANELGLKDMTGNVSEWCWDIYDAYPGGQTDYRGAASGTYRVTRGGSWNDSASYCTVASRSISDPNGRGNYVGFRVVRP